MQGPKGSEKGTVPDLMAFRTLEGHGEWWGGTEEVERRTEIVRRAIDTVFGQPLRSALGSRYKSFTLQRNYVGD